jgi:luciferase family oxidoreductase group 1
MQLAILDQSAVRSGHHPAESIRETVALAQACEGYGYGRYWLAEHHASPAVAGSAPEVLLGALAVATRRIRIGSAGVMLPHYSALKVAECFRVLEALAPGRVDLGLGRAPGGDRRTAFALNPLANEAVDHFPAQVRDLLAWVRGEPLVVDHPFAGVVAEPTGPGAPEPWILGSSGYGAQVAAHFGLPYCFAHFITDGHGAAEALDLYRSLYKPSEQHPRPYAAVSVWAFVAASDAEAEREFLPRAVWRLGRDRGVYAPLPSPEEAAAYPFTPSERARVERMRAEAFLGTGERVLERLRGLAGELGVEEVAVLTTASTPDVRRESYRLLAQAAGLAGERPAAAA